MTPEIYLGIAVAAPIILAVGLRINAGVLFMSLCVGAVLVEYVSGNALTIASKALNGNLSDSTLNLVLLILPVVLTATFMFHSVHGTRAIINILPALATGLLAAILTEPLLAPATQKTIAKSSLWHQIVSLEPSIVAGGAFVALAFMWFQHHYPSHKHYSHKSKLHSSRN